MPRPATQIPAFASARAKLLVALEVEGLEHPQIRNLEIGRRASLRKDAWNAMPGPSDAQRHAGLRCNLAQPGHQLFAVGGDARIGRLRASALSAMRQPPRRP